MSGHGLWIHGRIFGLTVLALVCLGVALEAGARVYIWVAHGVPGKTYGIHYYDPEIGGRLRPSSYNLTKQFNNLAFQSTVDTVVPKPPGTFRVVAYGGSTTICFNLPTGKCWPRLLERNLRAKGLSGVEILNAGDAAWSLSHAYARARGELRQLEPDLVLLYSGFNEVRNAWGLRREGVDLEQVVKEGRVGVFTRATLQSDDINRNSVLYKAWMYYLYGPYVRPVIQKTHRYILGGHPPGSRPAGFGPEVAEHYAQTIKAFVALIRNSGARPVFVMQAANPEHASAMRRAQYSRHGARVAGDLGALIIDGQAFVPDDPAETTELFIETGYHLSAIGAERFARFMTDAIDWDTLAGAD